MMKLSFVLVLVLAGAASGAIEKRILGSKECGKERQYHVQIESEKGGKSCGGALLNTRWVITASHCAERIVNLELGLNADSFISKWTPFGKTKQKIKPEQQFTFKDEGGHPHDIMLIKLNEDASPKLSTIKLPPAGCKRPEQNEQVQVGGFEPSNMKKFKLRSSVNCATTEMRTCGENDKPSGKYHSDESTTMCAFRSGVDACFGDGGSAVEYQGLLYGIIVNKAVDECVNPIVMLDICYYREWIDKTMREK